MKITSFKDLTAWKEGHKLVLMTYKYTKGFPTEEKFGLVDQMRRCSVSITSNIAEGFSKKGAKEKSQFYHMSLGSLTELENQITISKDLEYVDENVYSEFVGRILFINKLTHGLIKSASTLYT